MENEQTIENIIEDNFEELFENGFVTLSLVSYRDKPVAKNKIINMFKTELGKIDAVVSGKKTPESIIELEIDIREPSRIDSSVLVPKQYSPEIKENIKNEIKAMMKGLGKQKVILKTKEEVVEIKNKMENEEHQKRLSKLPHFNTI